MLYNGEQVGDGTGREVDGTTLTAKSLSNALATVAVAERHSMLDPGPYVYMEKLVVASDLRSWSISRRPSSPTSSASPTTAASRWRTSPCPRGALLAR
jgi:fructose-1,6-bisphosphatase/sedoheptulose 1,7-bisphosphatase-like protein